MPGTVSIAFLAASVDTPAGLASGLVEGGVLSSEPPVRPEELADAIRLQAAIRRAFEAAAAGDSVPARDAATLNSYASDEPPVPVLRADGTIARGATDPLRAALAAIARDAIETVAAGARDLRVCEGPQCGGIFLDRSRGKRRRWCSMRGCGNRAKVAAFRRRAPSTAVSR